MIAREKLDMRIAFVGLGQMGRPMAINLLRMCPGLLVHTTSGRAYPELTELGAMPSDDLRTLASSDLVFLSLPNDEVVQRVLFGADGIAQWMHPGSIVVDTSTIGYDNWHIERLLQIIYANDCPSCFRSLHDSQAHLTGDALELFPCLFNDDFALISEGQFIPDELDERCPSTGLVRQVVYSVIGGDAQRATSRRRFLLHGGSPSHGPSFELRHRTLQSSLGDQYRTPH